jgi:hypothetical protein
MKFRPVRAELFHADGWTDMTKLRVAFRNFAKAPKSNVMFKYRCNPIYLPDTKTENKKFRGYLTALTVLLHKHL